MNVEIISIGDELLSGKTINTNASFIAESLNNCGYSIVRVSTIADKENDLLEAIIQANDRADIIITSGGLGPTNDDITKSVLCKYYNCSLAINNEICEEIAKLFSEKNLHLSETNREQAYVPKKAQALRNTEGTAPGLLFTENNKILIALPGVPFEMKTMVNNYVIPALLKISSPKAISQKTVLTTGMGESFLADYIKEWESNLNNKIKLAYLPSPGLVKLHLSTTGNKKTKLDALIEKSVKELLLLIPDFIYGYNNQKIEEIIGNLLKNKNQSLCTAESCTGGYIAHKITSIPGSSAYYKGSVIAYNNTIKTNQLGVPEKIITKNGAVSKEVVIKMAKNIKEKFNCDYSIAVSGIAGPNGGTNNKPCGLTWIAIATPTTVITSENYFGKNRQHNIQKTCLTALNILRKELVKNS